MKSHDFTLDITTSDMKPGVVLLTFNRSDGEYVGVKLAGIKLQTFVHAMVKAYTEAVNDQGKADHQLALKQIDTFICNVKPQKGE